MVGAVKTSVRCSLGGERLILPAPAKVNLFLHITGSRADGMHELQTVFQLLDYGDEIRLCVRDDGEINVRCSENIAPENNIVLQAALLLRDRRGGTDCGVDIEVRKRIPIGAGLGGGSSDAATVLHGLNHLWGMGCSEADLLQLAIGLGADVPVFAKGYSAWGEGIGEHLITLDLPPRYFAVFTPPLSISTSEMFGAPNLRRDCPRMAVSEYRIGDGDNVFQTLASARFTEIADGMKWLSNYAVPRLSGTGSAFFAWFDDAQQVRDVLARAPDSLNGFVAKGLRESPLHAALRRFRSQ